MKELFARLAMLWRLLVWSLDMMLWSISSITLGIVNLGDWDAEIVDGDSLRLFLWRVLWVWVAFKGSKIPLKNWVARYFCICGRTLFQSYGRCREL